MRFHLLVCASLLFTAFAPPSLNAQDPSIFIVNSLGDAPAANPAAGTGQTSTGDITLRSAIMAAEVDGVPSLIEFQPSLFQGGPVEIVVGSTLPPIGTALDVVGPGSELLTVRTNSDPIMIFLNSPGGSVRGLALTGSTQGAVHNVSSTLEVRECVLHDNNGLATNLEGGGGIMNFSGNLTIIDSVIGPNNTAQYSGAVDNFFGSGNQLVVINSTFVGNRASLAGGVLYNGGTNNTAQFLNCTITQNTAGEDAGALLQDGTSGGLTIVNCTIVENAADGFAGGIYLLGSTNTVLVNSVVANNTEGGNVEVNIDGTVSSSSQHNFISDGNFMDGIQNGQNGNQIGTPAAPLDPMLLPWSEADPFPILIPAEGSPLINAGTPAIPQQLVDHAVTTDVRGEDRLQGPAVDIGSVEVQEDAPVIPGDYNGDGVVNIKDVTILAAHIVAGVPLPVDLDPDYNGNGIVDINDPQKLAADIANGTVGGP